MVTALSSSATAFIPKIIYEPHRVPQLLADNIPKSSNFYLTYFILQGLASSVKAVMNWSDLLEYLFYRTFIYKTPRDKYNQYTSLKGISWGKVYPKFTNFIIIALVYVSLFSFAMLEPRPSCPRTPTSFLRVSICD